MSLHEIIESVKKMDVREEAELLEYIIGDFFLKTGIKPAADMEEHSRRVAEAQSAYDFLDHESKSGYVPSEEEINYYHHLAVKNHESR